jgi:glycosyltransferase involved in cell wall biosynthesis
MELQIPKNVQPKELAYSRKRTLPIRVMQILGDPRGGIRKHVHEVILGLPSTDFVCSYAHGCTVDANFADEIDQVREHTAATLALKVRKAPHLSDLYNVALLARHARSAGIEVLHGHGAKAGVYARLVSRLCGIKAVYTPHGGSVHAMFSPLKTGLYGAAEKLLLPLTDVFLFESRYSAESYQARVGKQPRRSIVNHHGIRIPDGEAIARRAQLLDYPRRFPRAFHIGMFGILRHQKGQEFGVQAIAELVRAGWPLMLHVYGDGPDRARLERLAGSLGLSERICFHGHVTDAEAHMYCVDLVLIPSLFESFGYVAIEAMSLRRAVIAANVGGLREIVENGSTGMLVEPGNVEEFKNAISFLVGNDRARLKFIEAGYQRFLHEFTYDRMIHNICTVYHELAGR